jgi:hypothetical protein
MSSEWVVIPFWVDMNVPRISAPWAIDWCAAVQQAAFSGRKRFLRPTGAGRGIRSTTG